MPGQGIVVNIQAKIEGWQAQLKQIQDAMKNLKVGSEISKGLEKDLKQVETMINSLGKNMNHRLTSDSQITGFTDKVKEVEVLFDSLGRRMSSINFNDLNMDYITANFKDLLTAIEAATQALSAGMETSLQGAIADSKELQKEFSKMKLDPKDLNMDQMREALASRGEGLAKDLQAAQKETARLKQEMESAIEKRDSLLQQSKAISNTSSETLFGGMIPTNGTVWDEKAIKEKVDEIRSKLIALGANQTDLKILPDVKELMHQAKWDQIPQELTKILNRVQTNIDTKAAFARQNASDAVHAYRVGNGAEIRAERAFNDNIRSQDQLEALIKVRVQEETRQLREEVEELRKQLNDKATAPFKGTGKSFRESSAAGMQAATDAAAKYRAQLDQVKAGEQMLGKLQGVVQRWFSIYAVIRMVSNAIKQAAQNIQELDTTMTEIAIVTKMDQGDLWKQMPQYTAMAREYASSIKGVYEVSQIYYQQGLQMNEVMSLTESTLKMARISGLGYSEAADYMTNAVRSFKMEMSEATRVVDVYSAVAASSASNVTELATAMSKTASSAQAVGSSFENTTAMLAVMIEATRESPENIGSAMKSIISRYGELKENKVGIDAEGEEYSLNKVDKALQTVGISIHDAAGEFRDFDEVIFELAEHWNEIDKNTQRYIATVMAGNRQQSRFLALVSSSDRLKEEREKAENSEDASQLQFLKSLDSIDAKKQQLQTSIQSIYTDSGIENVYKGLLDFANKVLVTFDNLSSQSGLGTAIAKIGATFTTLATLVTNVFGMIKARMAITSAEITAKAKVAVLERMQVIEEGANRESEINSRRVVDYVSAEEKMTAQHEAEEAKRNAATLRQQAKMKSLRMGAGMVLSTIGLGFTTSAATLDENKEREKKANQTLAGSLLSGVGTFAMMGGPIGAIMGLLSAVPGIMESIEIRTETHAERIANIQNELTETSNKAIKSKDEYKSLADAAGKLKELAAAQYDSAEAKEAYLNASNELAESYPELISYIDNEGNKIVELTNYYKDLEQEKKKAYQEDAIEAATARIKSANNEEYRISQMNLKTPHQDELFPESWLSWVNGLNFINGEGLFDRTNIAFNDVVDSLSKGYGFGIALGDHGKYNASDTLDYVRAVFGTDRVFRDENSANFTTNLQNGLNALGLVGDENFQLKLALDNENGDVYQRIGSFIEGLMEAGKGLGEINTALSAIWGSSVSLNEDLWSYRDRIKNSEEYIKNYGEQTVKSENLSLYNSTKDILGITPSSNAEDLFMRQDFFTQWDEFYKAEKEANSNVAIEDAWRRFAAKAEENISEAQQKYAEAINAITDPTLQTEIKKAFEDSSGASINEVKRLWIEVGKSNPGSAMEQFLYEYYIELDERLSKTLNEFEASKAANGAQFETKITSLVSNFNSSFTSAILGQYTKIFKDDNISQATKELLSNGLDNIYSAISAVTDPEAQNALLSKMSTLDITSLSDLDGLMTAVKNMDLGIDSDKLIAAIQALITYTNVNLNTEFSNFTTTIINELETFDKALSSATKGMDLKTATEMAEKLGISIADFELKDGKFYFKDYQMLQEAYITNSDEFDKQIKERIEAYQQIETILSSGTQESTIMDLVPADLLTDLSNYALGGPEENREMYEQRYQDILDWAQEQELNIESFTAALDQYIEDGFTIISDIPASAFDLNFNEVLQNSAGNIDEVKKIIDDAQYDAFFKDNNLTREQLYSFIESYFSSESYKSGKDFQTYLSEELPKEWAAIKEKTDAYMVDQLARSYLSVGNVEDFLKTTGAWKTTNDYSYMHGMPEEIRQKLADQANADLIDHISTGDISNLPKELEQYAKLIYDTYHSVYSSISSSMNMAISGGANQIFVDDTNISVLQDLYDQGFFNKKTDQNGKVIENYQLQKDDVVSLTEEVINGEKALDTWLNEHYTNATDKIKGLSDYYSAISKNTIQTSTDLMEKTGTIEFEEMANYLQDAGAFDFETQSTTGDEYAKVLEKYGLEFNEKTKRFIIKDTEKYLAQLKADVEALGDNATLEERNAAQARYDTGLQRITTERTEALNTLFNNYDEISQTDLEQIANAFGENYETLRDSITEDNGLGGRKVNLKKAQSWLKTEQLTDEQIALQEELIAGIADVYLKNIQTVVSLITQGTTSQKDIEAFKTTYKSVMDKELDPGAFKFDKELNSWALAPQILREFIEKQATDAGLVGEEWVDYVSNQLNQNLASAIDFSSFISAENNDDNSLAYKKLKKSLTNYYEGLAKSTDPSDYIDKARKLASTGKFSDETVEEIAERLAGEAVTYNENILGMSVDEAIETIRTGDTEAVKLATKIARASGKELTAEEMQKYYAPLAEKYSNMANQVAELTVGQYVGEGELRDILHSVGAVDESGIVIASVSEMVSVYQEIYKKISSGAHATAAQLNSVYAKMRTAQEQGDIDAISVMGEAMGMTYDSLGQMLGKYGTKLEDWLRDNADIYEQIGGGKIRITDFKAFATGMGWKEGSEEYTSAFKAYNDSLIALDRKTEKSIYEEVSKIASAKGGERVNLTETARILDKNLTASAKEELTKKLQQAGVSLNDGILTLSENADIEAAIDAITSEKIISSMLIPEELAELQDAVDALLTNTVSLIKNGIDGSLSNKDRSTLESFASKRGIKLDFTKTEKGLKLSAKSAMQLYLTIKDIDKLQAQALLPEISKMSDKYSSLQNACKRYNDLIQSSTKNLLEEKTVLEDLIKLMMTDPSSYNFMSGSELPASWQYAENYLNNMHTALEKLKDAASSSFIDPSDFYNIVNTAAAYNPNFNVQGMGLDELLSKAGGAITIKNGKVGIDLSKNGLNLTLQDLQGIYGQLRSGLELFTEQAEAYYEVNDKFEKISDAVNRIPKIDFSSIFPEGKSVKRAAFKKYIGQFAEEMPDLTKSLKGIFVNGKKLSDLFKQGATWQNWHDAGFTQDSFTEFIKGIGEIDWSDATQAAAHVSELIKATGIAIDMPIDANSFIHIYPSGEAIKIDLNDKQFKKKVIDEYNKHVGKAGFGSKKVTGQNNDIVTELQALMDRYPNTVDVEERLNIRRMLAIAEGRFDPTNFVKNKDGSWSYNYNGKEYKVMPEKGEKEQDVKDKLGDRIAAAIEMEDEGFTVETVTDTTIKATKRLKGGIQVEVKFENNKKTYTAKTKDGKPHSSSSYNDLMNELAQSGFGDESQVGDKVTLPSGKQGTVLIDSYTGLVYTHYVEGADDHYIFEGHDFDSYGKFRSYLNLRDEFDGDFTDSTNENGNKIRTITVNEGLTVEYNLTTGEVIYKINGMNVSNKESFQAWQAAMGENDFTSITLEGGAQQAKYLTADGIPVTLTVNTDGTFKYTFTSPEGTFEATSMAGYENALAGLAQIRGGTIDGGSASYTITMTNGYTVEVNGDKITVKCNGKEVPDGDLPEDVKKKIESLKSAGPNASTSVDITATDNVTSIVDEILKALEDLPPIKTIDITAKFTSLLPGWIKTLLGLGGATGNISLAHGNVDMGMAKAGGTPTLMGELGPELVVSHGRYFVVGQGGAEMVNLADDAIVFNHIQTRQLLSNGKTGRGTPQTNERKAAGMATGNVNGGPARKNGVSVTPETWDKKSGISSDILTLLSKLTTEQKSKLSSLMSDLITKGFENIDWEDIEKTLNKALTEELKKAAQSGSLRDFVKKYGEYCGKTTKEINETYFQAWQKDLEAIGQAEEQMSALENLSFYSNGKIGGNSSDWTTILGDKNLVIQAAEQGILQWNATLRQYIAKDQASMEQFMTTRLGDIWNFPEVVIDQAQSVIDQVQEIAVNALSDEGISAADKSKFEAMLQEEGYVGSLEFTKTKGNKFKLSDKSAKQIIDKGYTIGIGEGIGEAITYTKGEDLKIEPEIDEGFAAIQDAIRERVTKSIDYVKNLVEGTSNFQDYVALKDNLLSLDLGLTEEEIKKNLKYEETENGLKLKDNSFDWLTQILAKDYPKRVEALIKTANETYFKDWEDNMNKASADAAKQMQYFAGGGMSGSSSDWNNLLGGKFKVRDLVEQGILTYNEKLDTYVATSVEAIKKLGLDPALFDENVIKDSIRELFNNILDQFSKALGEGLTNVEVATFMENLHQQGINLDLTFKQTVDGLKLSTESAITLYNELKKVDAIQSQLMFKKLNESLKESNDHYKDATSVLARIKELQDKINDAEHYSDEKIKQYKEELSLAQEILAVRATSEDDSFDFTNKALPGGLNNALTYAKSWATAWKAFKEAAEDPDKDIIDFQLFYNTANEINKMAGVLGQSIDFLGYRLDGSIDNFDKLVTHASNSLGSSLDGSQFGVKLSKFGDDIKNGMNDYATSADTAMHTMAKAQIQVLDGLIAMFEVIVAMEEFDNADINKNGLLDLDEVFDLTGLSKDAYATATKFKAEFSDAANILLDAINSDEKWQAVAEGIKINGYSIKALLEDAADGYRDLADISAEDYQKMVSLLYEKLRNGDYDVNDIYNSLKENLLINDSDWDGIIEINDLVFNVKYGVQLTKTEEGYKTPGGAIYPDAKSASQGLALEAIGGKDVKFDSVTLTSSGTLKVGESNLDVTVSTDDSGVVTYTTTSGSYSSLDDAIKAEWEAATKNHETTLDLEEWKIDQKIKIIPVVETDLQASSLELNQDQINAAIGKSYEEIKDEWNEAQKNGTKLTFEAKYGVSLNDQTTEEDWARFKELAGIETKNVEVNASINIVKVDGILSQLLSTDSEDKTVKLNVDAPTDSAEQNVDKFKQNIDNTTGTVKIDADISEAKSKLQEIVDIIDEIDTSVDIDVNVNQNGELSSGASSATGNAMAAGTQTLMGELGPELYVSNGRYHLAGQNGAEFVNLPDDAIVFNHLQTQRLLQNGSTGRGKPITNERNAVAMAKGSGPAAASARETLATLKQMRAMWQSLAEMSVSELAGKTTTNESKENIATWIQQVEKWYTLMQKIATLEKKITQEQKIRAALQSKLIAAGDKYAESQIKSLNATSEQLKLEQELAKSYLDEFNTRRKELNENGPFSRFYTFDENGQIIYRENGLEELTELFNPQYENNGIKYTAEEQVALAKAYGLSDFMKKDSEGKTLVQEENESASEFAVRQLDALKYSMDKQQADLQSYYDSWYEHSNTALDLEASRNQILQEIRDNQLDLEEKVLKAVEDREQAIIDKMSDEREALSKANEAYIKSLQDTLAQERKLYETNKDEQELKTLQRRLSILQRSGGSQSEINNLQKQLQEKSQTLYFDTQENQIQAVQDASDAQLEKLDKQIELMTESLEYAKASGLLWNDVYKVMSGTSEEITAFITENMADWKAKSTLAQEQEQKTLLFIAQQFETYRKEDQEKLFATPDNVTDDLEGLRNATHIDVNEKSEKDYNKINKEAEIRNAASSSTSSKTTSTGINSGKSSSRSIAANSKTLAETAREQKEKSSKSEETKISYTEEDWAAEETRQTDYLDYLEKQITKARNWLSAHHDTASMEEIQSYYDAIVEASNFAIETGAKLEQIRKRDPNYVIKYSHGGMVTQTGLVKVHGTDARPEAFMNADEVQMWKQDILGSSSHSLTTQLVNLRSVLDAIENSSSTAHNTVSEGITIEHAEVNMNVEQIANDYDARRAGASALDEMLKIARKAGNNSIRR